jgi:TadE-like protein
MRGGTLQFGADRKRRRSAAALALAIGLIVVVACAWVSRTVGGQPWLRAALTSGVSQWCGVTLIACAALLTASLCVLWRAGRASRARASRGEEGQAIIEFALVLPLLLMIVLTMAQVTLLMGANICVHYAAFSAARSAIVTIPSDLSEDEPQNVMLDYGAKYRRIRRAATWALIPVSSGEDGILEHGDGEDLRAGLEEFFEAYVTEPEFRFSVPEWVDERLGRKLMYAWDNTAVDVWPFVESRYIPSEGAADDWAEPGAIAGHEYGEDDDIRVRVEFAFPLSVPYVGGMFRRVQELAEVGQTSHPRTEPGVLNVLWVQEPLDTWGLLLRATCRLTNEGVRDYIEEPMLNPF